MKILARLIRHQLEADAGKWEHCAIYEDQLRRVWSIDELDRKAKIAQFATEHGFKLSYYKQGLCAIFEKEAAHR